MPGEEILAFHGIAVQIGGFKAQGLSDKLRAGDNRDEILRVFHGFNQLLPEHSELHGKIRRQTRGVFFRHLGIVIEIEGNVPRSSDLGKVLFRGVFQPGKTKEPGPRLLRVLPQSKKKDNCFTNQEISSKMSWTSKEVQQYVAGFG